MRIAIGSILTECNQFGGSPIDIDWFKRYDLAYGEELLKVDAGVVGGALATLRRENCAIAPLVYASTCPGGYISKDCYAHLKGELLNRLQESLPIDGVLLLLHGAAVAAGTPDIEGDLITAVRQVVGSTIPIVATLDLHAHVTSPMVADADALVAWETYPHRDSETTGARGAQLLVDALKKNKRLAMVMAKVPVITGGILGGTEGDGAFAQLMRKTKALEKQEHVLSTSLFLVHPYLDQEQMGSGCLVVTDGDKTLAQTLATEIAMDYWHQRHDLEAEVLEPAEAIARAHSAGPGSIVLVETADCAGGGAAGDSVASLRALLHAADIEDALVPVVDPQAAQACHAAGLNAELELSLGHRLDPHWGSPLKARGRVAQLSDGCFTYQGGIWDGVQGEMGPTALFAIGPIRVLITTHATYDWADEQWQALGIDPRQTRFIVAKNPMNFHNVYAAAATYILDTPGPTPASVKNLPFKNLQRPFFPKDKDIPNLKPHILR